MKRLFLTLISLILFFGYSLSQDMAFSQFNRSSMLMNPARLSEKENLVFGGMYRRMGLTENVNVQSSFFFLESPVKINERRFGGMGIAMLNSSDGGINPIQLTGGILALNKRLQVTDKSFLSVGFQGGYYYKHLDYNDYSTGSQWEGSGGYNPDLPNGESLLNESAKLINLNSGIYWMIPGRAGHNQTSVGFSLQHINQPDYTFIRSGEPKPLTFQVYGKQRVYHNEFFKASLSAMYRKGTREWLSLGTRITYFFKKQTSYNVLDFEYAGLAANYNHNRSVVIMFELSRKDMGLGFSYDIGLPGTLYEYATGGIYELSFTIKSMFSENKEPVKKQEPVIVHAEERTFFDDRDKRKESQQSNETRRTDSLKQRIDSLQQLVGENPENVNIKLSKNFSYEFNKAVLTEEAKQFLDNLALMLLKSPELKIKITGHSDNRGTKEDNLIISKERAENVAEYLKKRGVKKNRITTEAAGSSQPVVPNNSEENREKNRRVEFEIYSK
jgi:type IX secretion system PorP/SprF family membrane protein